MLKNMKLAPKLFGAFAIVLLLMASLGLFALLQMSKVNDSSTDIASNWMPSIKLVKEIDTNTSDYRIAELEHVVSEVPADMQAAEAKMRKLVEGMEKTEGLCAKLISSLAKTDREFRHNIRISREEREPRLIRTAEIDSDPAAHLQAVEGDPPSDF